ncbi:MAG: tyrosine-protein phosphatase [Armatimonadia bacterium]
MHRLPKPWLFRLQGAGLMLLLVLVVAVLYFNPGVAGWLTYVGYQGKTFGPAPRNSRPVYPRNDVPGVTNFAIVSRNLYRGAAADALGFRTLKLMGVKTVVDLRQFHSDLPLLKGTGLQYYYLPANPSEIDDDEVAQFLRIVRNPDNQPVFVHCTAGSDRTGVMVAIYRVMDEEWPVEAAAQELPIFGFHKVFQPLLQYLSELDRAHLNALSASIPPPKVLLVK